MRKIVPGMRPTIDGTWRRDVYVRMSTSTNAVSELVSDSVSVVPTTPYPELNDLLSEIADRAHAALGDAYVGLYLTGSFAIGDADEHSDCDFVVVYEGAMSVDAESAIRSMHAALPERDGQWNKHLEGAYPPRADLADISTIGSDWLTVDHGATAMDWANPFNRHEVRWTLREHGVPVEGPDPKAFVAEVTADALRDQMRVYARTLTPDILGWATREWAFSQRYMVSNWCRLLYTLEHGTIASKKASQDWAADTLHPRWAALIRRARNERDRGLDRTDPPHPGSWEETLEFAEWCRQRALQPAE